jgi:hypothetical protein
MWRECELAYELYEVRGRINGQAEEDWLQAEVDLARSSEPKAVPASGSCDNIGLLYSHRAFVPIREALR